MKVRKILYIIFIRESCLIDRSYENLICNERQNGAIMKKLIIINGIMGVGKTTVSKALYKELNNSFWLDGDNCWMMNPFNVNEENKRMVLDNITYIVNNYIKNSSSEHIVFNWVIQTDDIMNQVLSRLNLENVKVYKITLMASKDALIERITSDISRGIRNADNLNRSLNQYNLYNQMNTIKVDTTNKRVKEIIENIKEIIVK